LHALKIKRANIASLNFQKKENINLTASDI
jgi:hypothetical protein